MSKPKWPKWILDAAKQLDTPEMRELYRKQKLVNKGLDKDVQTMSEELQNLFNDDDHSKDSSGDKCER